MIGGGCSSMVERAAYNRLTQVRFLTPLFI